MIKCITFDLDDTLWEIKPVIIKAEIKFYEWLETNYPQAAEKFNIEKLRKLMRQTAIENPEIKHDLTKVRIKAYNSIRDLFNFSDNMPMDAYKYFMHYRNKVTLFNKAEYILSALEKSYIIGTITNGNASLEEIGIKKYFDFEIKASEVGCMKPDKKIFLAAITESKCNPSEIVHVGDSYEKDILGAISSNMNYIWLNNKDETNHNLENKNIIKSLSELPTALQQIY